MYLKNAAVNFFVEEANALLFQMLSNVCWSARPHRVVTPRSAIAYFLRGNLRCETRWGGEKNGVGHSLFKQWIEKPVLKALKREIDLCREDKIFAHFKSGRGT